MAEALDALFDEKSGTTEPAAAAPATPEPVKTEPAPQAAPTPASEPLKQPEPGQKDPFFVAMLDEREKRQRAERERDEERAKNRQPQAIPSIQDDPEAYAAHLESVQQRIAVNTRFEVSEAMATEKFGAEVVKSAMDWGMERAKSSPAFAQEYMRQSNPVAWIVKQQQKDKVYSELGDDEAAQKAYIERRARELGLIPDPTTQPPPPAPAAAAPPQPTPPVKPAAPPRSLASAPSWGGTQSIPTGPGEAFNAAFPN